MNRRAIILLASMLAAGAVAAQEATSTAAPPPQQDSPLVKAAKAAGGPKRKPSKKVITNADVKNSNGKLVVLPAKAPPASAPPPAAQPTKGPIELHDEQLRAQAAAADRVATLEKKVSSLETELRRIEDAYYAENDPSYRDTKIVPRFKATRRQLDEARKVLAAARDAQTKLHDKPSS